MWCVFVCLCVCVCACGGTYISVCILTDTCTHTHTHTHTHSHTHTQEFHSETLDTDVDVSNLAKKGKLANSDAEDYFFFRAVLCLSGTASLVLSLDGIFFNFFILILWFFFNLFYINIILSLFHAR